jgi:hypothetical protein
MERFGALHTVAGGLLTQLWGFPENLCGHAENHHEESGFDSEEDRVVRKACRLASAMGYPEVRLRVEPAPEGIECVDECRPMVEERILEFLR